ncbi:unnamed protein product [Allacma fusca]|uniref:Cytochrome P450 n=1 Tax=Allacma fusca TaxID=39272 RepID=A0A8J2KDN2_9HEXA|nr:unnamed protein product [Allacma fusca]
MAPFDLFHASTENTSFEGYDMPTGTLIVPNHLLYVHHDPENFRPEGFINPKGKIHKKEYIIPFSIGERVCAEETLARDGIFLFLTKSFQQFEFQADPGKPMPSMNKPVQFFDFLDPPKFFVIVTDRS